LSETDLSDRSEVPVDPAFTERIIMQSLNQTQNSSHTAHNFILRLPHGMRAHIATVAAQNRRSMNTEIIARLQQSLLQENGFDSGAATIMDSPELSSRERELLQRFRQLGNRQQNALTSLIAVSTP
jgi:plasmid stability protein